MKLYSLRGCAKVYGHLKSLLITNMGNEAFTNLVYSVLTRHGEVSSAKGMVDGESSCYCGGLRL